MTAFASTLYTRHICVRHDMWMKQYLCKVRCRVEARDDVLRAHSVQSSISRVIARYSKICLKIPSADYEYFRVLKVIYT